MKLYLIGIILLLSNVHLDDATPAYVTQTVYGFLDFTTTMGDTVMVFSPQSAPPLEIKGNVAVSINSIETKPLPKNNVELNENSITPTKLEPVSKNDKDFVKALPIKNAKPQNLPSTNASPSLPPPPSPSLPIPSPQPSPPQIIKPSSAVSVAVSFATVEAQPIQKDQFYEVKPVVEVPVESEEDPAIRIENDLDHPNYDLLSREPAEYAEETYRLVNLKGNRHVNTPSGKQASQSAAAPAYKNRKSKIRPTLAASPVASTLRVLKTAAPVLTVTTPKPITPRSGASYSNKNQNRAKHSNARAYKNELSTPNVIQVNAVTTPKSHSENTGPKKSRSHGKSKRRKNSNRNTSTQKGQNHQETTPGRKYQNKIQHTPTEATGTSSSSLYMFKLNRTPGRWQYKTSPKPRVTIRKSNNDASTTPHNNPLLTAASTNSVSSIADAINESVDQNAILDQADLESSGSESGGANFNNINDPDEKQRMFVETLNVDISTPADFNDTYYEIATIKTPFTFQAGNVKKTRFITVTSTLAKVLKSESPIPSSLDDVPLIENILDTSKKTDNLLLDGSITTLSPLYVTDDVETPSLETITESLSIVQTKLRTQVLPIIFEQKNSTTYTTLVHTYDFTSLIVATKTLSPFDANQFLPTKNFKDFGGSLDEAGSELNLELEFGDENPDDLRNDGYPNYHKEKPAADISVSQNDPLQQQLSLLSLLKPSMPLSTVITKTLPVLKLETLWESYVVPIVQSGTTNFRTLSKSVGVVDKTEYRLESTTIPLLPPTPPPPPITPNPYLLPVPELYQTITNSHIHETITTAINSKVLKLTFGARTAYTTIFSTNVVPTAVTMYLTSTIPVAATPPAYPSYFPPPYPPYAYVG